ncbi:hypothetical protein M0R45_033216 [Rubus argutus]|uniref:Uncharacterized protein n=1 Tax=Rubus argutus TaxID=59490 RepID=A0AAW1WMP0_RUBAR
MMINGRHKNKYAWKPNAGVNINETEVGGRFRPLSEITGVCPRCKEQIEWKRRYGKYKPQTKQAKCQRCTKRAVRQSHHKLCQPCAKEHDVYAKMNAGKSVKTTAEKEDRAGDLALSASLGECAEATRDYFILGLL